MFLINSFLYKVSASGWDVSTATYDTKNKDISSEDTDIQGIFFKPDGTKMYVAGGANDTIYQYSIS